MQAASTIDNQTYYVEHITLSMAGLVILLTRKRKAKNNFRRKGLLIIASPTFLFIYLLDSINKAEKSWWCNNNSVAKASSKIILTKIVLSRLATRNNDLFKLRNQIWKCVTSFSKNQKRKVSLRSSELQPNMTIQYMIHPNVPGFFGSDSAFAIFGSFLERRFGPSYVFPFAKNSRVMDWGLIQK